MLLLNFMVRSLAGHGRTWSIRSCWLLDSFFFLAAFFYFSGSGFAVYFTIYFLILQIMLSSRYLDIGVFWHRCLALCFLSINKPVFKGGEGIELFK